MHEVHLLNYLDYIYCRRVFPNQLRYVIGRQCNKNNGIHSIKYAGWTNPSLPRGGISTSYAILILRNNWKFKYILMFGKIKINKPGICKYTIKTMKRLFSIMSNWKKKNTRLTQPIRFSRVERWVEKACIWFHRKICQPPLYSSPRCEHGRSTYAIHIGYLRVVSVNTSCRHMFVISTQGKGWIQCQTYHDGLVITRKYVDASPLHPANTQRNKHVIIPSIQICLFNSLTWHDAGSS